MDKPKGGQGVRERKPETDVCVFTESQKQYFVWKRILDVVISLLALILLAPLMLGIMLVIKTSSPNRPVFFKQYRIGRDYHVFRIYKFRTMHITVPKNIPTYELDNADKAITKFGKFLRRFSLDELPQLVNVLKGDMSLIGPRPLVYTEREIRALRKQQHVYEMRPGISGIAQINGRDNVSVSEKVRMDVEYVHYASFTLDFEIFCRTFVAVLLQKGVAEGRQELTDERRT